MRKFLLRFLLLHVCSLLQKISSAKLINASFYINTTNAENASYVPAGTEAQPFVNLQQAYDKIQDWLVWDNYDTVELILEAGQTFSFCELCGTISSVSKIIYVTNPKSLKGNAPVAKIEKKINKSLKFLNVDLEFLNVNVTERRSKEAWVNDYFFQAANSSVYVLNSCFSAIDVANSSVFILIKYSNITFMNVVIQDVKVRQSSVFLKIEISNENPYVIWNNTLIYRCQCIMNSVLLDLDQVTSSSFSAVFQTNLRISNCEAIEYSQLIAIDTMFLIFYKLVVEDSKSIKYSNFLSWTTDINFNEPLWGQQTIMNFTESRISRNEVYLKSTLLSIRGGLVTSQVTFSRSLVSLNRIDLGVFIEMAELDYMGIWDCGLENNTGMGSLFYIEMTDLLEIKMNNIRNLMNFYIFDANSLKTAAFASNTFYNDGDYYKNTEDFWKKKSNWIYSVGGCIRVSDFTTLTINVLNLVNLRVLNTPALKIDECSDINSCRINYKQITIGNFSVWKNFLRSYPFEMAVLHVTLFTNEMQFTLDTSIFASNLLVTDPAYHNSAGCLILDSLQTNVTISRTTFEGNSALSQVATFRIKAFDLTLTKVNITKSNNFGQADESGVTFMSFQCAEISDCFFLENRSGKEGALYLLSCQEAILKMSRNRFDSNIADSGAALNAGPASNFSLVYIENGIFLSNKAVTDGGALFFSRLSFFSNVVFESCQFGRNFAKGLGGAVFFLANNVTNTFSLPTFFSITLSRFQDNSAVDGSAVCFQTFPNHTKTFLYISRTTFKKSAFTAPDSGSVIAKVLLTKDPEQGMFNTDCFVITIDYSSFDFLGPFTNDTSEDYGIIKMFFSTVNIEQTSFTNIDFTNGVGIILLFQSSGTFYNLSIINCSTARNYVHKNHDSCITVGYQVPSAVMIVKEAIDNFSMYYFVKCLFHNISSINSAGGAITFIKNGRGTVIQDCVFSLNEAMEGAAIYAVESMRLSISFSLFIKNLASGKGGAISFESTFCSSIKENQFVNNLAYAGGAIAILDLENENKSACLMNASTKIGRNSFQMFRGTQPLNNDVINFFLFGFGVFYAHSCNTSSNFPNNSLPSDFVGFYEQNCLLDDRSLRFQISLPTPFFNKTFTYNNFSFKYTNDNGSSLIELLDNNTIILCPSTEQRVEFLAIYDDLKNISRNPFNTSYGNLSLNSSMFSVRLRECIRGEHFNNGRECEKCPPGTYSIEMRSTQCSPCPQGATCNGGADLEPQAGHWRSSLYSDKIYYCYMGENVCLGGNNTPCAKGYAGPLCMGCDVSGDTKYIRARIMDCSPCADNSTNWAMVVLVFFAIIFYEAYYIWKMYSLNKLFSEPESLNEESAIIFLEKRRSGMYFKILTQYFQIITIVQSLDGNVSKYIKWFFSIFGSPSSSVVFSTNCIIVENYPDYIHHYLYVNVGIITFAVLAKVLLFVAIWCSLKAVLRSRISKRVLIVGLLSLAYVEQPGMLTNLFGFFYCENIDDKIYLIIDHNFECYSDEYWIFVKAIVIPFIVIWALIYPGLSFATLFLHRKDLQTTKTKIMLGSLYQEYKPQFYFWEFVQMAFKLSLIMLNDFIVTDTKTKGLTFIIVIMVYTWAHDRYRPYTHDYREFNTLVSYCNKVFISTVFLAIYSQDNQSQVLSWIAKVVLFSVNIVFFIIMIIGFLTIFKRYYEKIMKLLKRCFARRFRDSANMVTITQTLIEPDNLGEDSSELFNESGQRSKAQSNVRTENPLLISTAIIDPPTFSFKGDDCSNPNK